MGKGQVDVSIHQNNSPLPVALFPDARQRGFTLLELMIVITIIIILAAIALPQYQKTTMHARETMLRYDLDTMRKLLDQYAADKGKLPQSMDDLVAAGYMRELPKESKLFEKYLKTLEDQEKEMEELQAKLKTLHADEVVARKAYDEFLANLSAE